ncbi:alpha-N-acetylglucosaminidase isoform X2 [Tribolium castaneum]|uniref:alpha-N-acetylglucosaminidase isoform X2 n=1 Tax=Tribolium castaneum TaxID=7070 RepID=UPI0000D55D11|nr:PREDICTED: alpha-N-acetylglucosaminidase isoform X2 [Tribolium castaneum]|eukprot:XP_973259.1 PREDICTED: alpha-N-acetylglucosaminidase isoform X2 [Tribolium castaneum]
MKIVLVFILITFNSVICFDHIRPKASLKTQTDAVKDLIKRLIPGQAQFFDIKIQPDLNHEDKDAFKIEKIGDLIQITGTTGVAAATGFNHYLKYFCNCHVSWETTQLKVPEVLPEVNLTITLNDRFRYYQNVCTTSYSFVWWDWTQWEKHIDWMVLNGFNLVLAFNGQEAIWDRVYKKFNLTREEIDEHFSGPAFLSWLRMGNMRGFGGPLSPAWHSRSLVLQKQILQRMRAFGIIPVLPAFAGHLPRAFKTLYPDANMSKMAPWNGFNDTYCCPYFLDPTEPLFNEIGKAFLSEQISEFGTDHMYNCDSFNENVPTSGDLTYLANVGKSIYKAMTDTDPDAVWVMQGWLFAHDFFYWTRNRAKAILTAVPKGKMIVLDLQSEQFPQYERLNQYFGQPYIWCMLHDFGGTLGMFGSSTVINEVPIKARHLENSTMIGTGLTPEGINQNYVIYELMTETAWRQAPVNLTEWFEKYSTRRYGFPDSDAENAWRILQRTVYDYQGLNRMRGKYAITKSPSLKIKIWTWYSTNDLLEAWTSLLEASDNLGANSGYLHDLVDVTRQVLQVYGDLYYKEMVKNYQSHDSANFQANSKKFLEILDDLDEILSTNSAFLLGPWLEAAKKAANDSAEEAQFEYNARNQITLWGPRGEIMDYANKQWAGVVSHFFAPRWYLFINYLNSTFDGAFNQTYIDAKMFKEVEEPFTFDRTEFPVEPIGDAVEIAWKIHKKWTSEEYRKHKFVAKDRRYKML